MAKRFPWKQFLAQVAAIAVPVALQNLLATTGSMVDTMMIGVLGETSVGAVGLCAQFSSLMFSCYWGFVGGGMLFFAQYYGNGDEDGINRSYGITLAFMMTMSVIFCGLAVLFPGTIMSLYTDKAEIQAIGVEYLRIAGFSYPLVVLSTAMASLLRCTGRVKIPLVASICSVLTNCGLNWLLISGHWGFPALGVRGAALATVCSGGVNVLVTAVLGRHHDFLLKIRRHFRWNREAVRLYLRKCFPIICNEVLIGVGNMVINVVLGHQAVEAIAATAVFRTLEGFAISFFSGFTNAASVLVGTEVGAGHLEEAWERAKRLLLLCCGVIFAMMLVLLACSGPLLRLMSLSGESFRLCTWMLVIYVLAVTLRMGNWIRNDTFRSAGDATFGTVLEIVFMYAMVLPAVSVSGLVLRLPFLAVFACCYIDEPIRFVMMQVHLLNGKWVRPVTPEGLAALPAFRERRAAGKKGEYAHD